MKCLVQYNQYADGDLTKFFTNILDNQDQQRHIIVDPDTQEEVRFILDDSDRIDYEFKQLDNERGFISFEVFMDKIPEDYKKLVDHLEGACNCGHSFSVIMSINNEPTTYYIDGDGADRIFSGGKSKIKNFSGE